MEGFKGKLKIKVDCSGTYSTLPDTSVGSSNHHIGLEVWSEI